MKKKLTYKFRGSETLDQILMQAGGAALIPITSFPGGGNLNQYFLQGFNRVWSDGMKDDFLTLKNTYTDYEVWVTGLSLGGALACVTAATISEYKYVPADKIKLVTFGEPRVGNTAFASTVENLVPYAFRVIHADDIIPHVPPKGTLGYYHHKYEVW